MLAFPHASEHSHAIYLATSSDLARAASFMNLRENRSSSSNVDTEVLRRCCSLLLGVCFRIGGVGFFGVMRVV